MFILKFFTAITLSPSTTLCAVLGCSAEVEAAGLTLPAPPLPGKWTLFALLLSPAPSRTLQFSPATSLTVVRPVEVEFRLAPSINVGESLEVDVKIGNNVNSCVDVSAFKCSQLMIRPYQLKYCIINIQTISMRAQHVRWYTKSPTIS